MILSLAQACPPEVRRRLRVTAIDINRTACDMAFINTSLWGIITISFATARPRFTRPN
jgi:methylase of polypeptide subunit release factors